MAGIRIGAAAKIVDLAEHALVRKMYPALATAAEERRHAADPQHGHRRRQHHAAAALLVLPQRRVQLPQEGRLALLRRRGREPVSRHLRRWALPHRSSVEPGRAGDRVWRQVPRRRAERRARDRCRRVLPDAERESLRRERAAAERNHHARDPAGARPAQRRLRSAIQAVARLAAGGGVGESGDGRPDREVGAHRDGRGRAGAVAGAGGRARARGQDDQRSGGRSKRRTPRWPARSR